MENLRRKKKTQAGKLLASLVRMNQERKKVVVKPQREVVLRRSLHVFVFFTIRLNSTIIIIMALVLRSPLLLRPFMVTSMTQVRGVRTRKDEKKWLTWPNDWLPFEWEKPEPQIGYFATGQSFPALIIHSFLIFLCYFR